MSEAGTPFGARALLFDLDGTLVDSVPSLARAVNRTLESLGRAPMSEEVVRGWVGNGAAMLIRRALAGNFAGEPEPDPALQDEALTRFLDFYGEAPEEGTRLYAGVEPFVRRMAEQGVPMAVVTNKPEPFVPRLLSAFGLGDAFAAVIGGDTLPQRKPDPAPLLFAADALGVVPEQCLMIGDSPADVRAARAAGMPVVCVSYGYTQGVPAVALGADRVVDSMLELL